MSEKFVVKVIVERVVRDVVSVPVSGCRCGGTCSRCINNKVEGTERKVDTVASVTVTASDIPEAVRKAKLHLEAEVPSV